MKKTIRLFSVQIWAVLGSMFGIGESKKKKIKALYVGFAVFSIVISGASYLYAYSIGMLLKQFGVIDLLPSIFMALTSIIVLFTTIYKVKGTIFGFKDYDMVMSLPVSNSQIVASRLILLYSINFVFVLIIIIPMMIAYAVLALPGLQFYIFGILMLFFIPLIPIIVASFFGTILTYLTMRFKYSNIVYIVLSFLLLILLVIAPFFLGNSEQALIMMSQSINRQINNIYPLSELYSKALIKGDVIMMLLFIGISIFTFMVFSFVVGKVFNRVNSVIMSERQISNYKLGALKSSSPLRAIYTKDLKRYFSSPVYVMNTGFGVIMLLLGSIALPFIDINSISGGMDITGSIKDVIPVFVIFCLATSCTTMASISIEGKSIWIIKNLPVSIIMIFMSKILVNLTILAPALIASILIAVTMKLPFINGLILILLVVSFSVFVALYGLVINLNFPNLSWSNETVIVKQSMASMINIFTSIGITVLLYLAITSVGNAKSVMLISVLILWLINILLFIWLTNSGKRQFKQLSS